MRGRVDLFLVFISFWGMHWTSEDVKTFFFGLHRYFQWKRVNRKLRPPPFQISGHALADLTADATLLEAMEDTDCSCSNYTVAIPTWLRKHLH